MSRDFNYEDVFMGVMEGKPSTYLRTFQDDYRLKRLTEAVKSENGTILDIGCGGGITTESLQYYYPKASLYGCDVSRQAIEYAKKFGSGKVKYGVIADKKLPYKNNFFDLCICLDVMEHVPDVDFFLKEVRRILKPGGKFFLLVPCEGQPLTHTWLFQKIHWGDKMTFKRYGHIHPEFTHKYVEDLLVKHNFIIKKRSYSEHFLFQVVSVLIYFWPLELLDSLLGKKSKNYTDSGVVRRVTKRKKNKFDPMILVRNTWLGLTKVMRFLTAWELDLLKNSSFTAWKIHTLAQVQKKTK